MRPDPVRLRPAALLLALTAAACGRGEPEGPTLEQQRARESAAAFFAQDDRAAALAALAPLLEVEAPLSEDLVRAAVVHRSQGSLDEAHAALERALGLTPDSAAVHYGIGQLALFDGELERAVTHLRRAHELAPDDVPTRLGLGQALEDTAVEEALALYRSVLDAGLDEAGSFYLTALFRTHRLLQSLDRLDEARPLLAEFQRLQERGFVAPTGEQVARGNLGTLQPPAPLGNAASSPPPPPGFAAPRSVALQFPGRPDDAPPEAFAIADFDNNGQLDVLVHGPAGFGLSRQDDGHGFETLILDEDSSGPLDAVAALDVDNDGDLDLVVARRGGLELWLAELTVPEEGPATFALEVDTTPMLPLDSPVLEILPVDHDHEGDLDLVVLTASGVRLLRNDAAGSDGTFSDATAEAGLPRGRFEWVVAEDLDSDQDVDLLLGGSGAVALASNARNGRFEDASSLLADVAPSAVPLRVHDVDGDGRPDLVRAAGEAVDVWRGLPSGRFEHAGGGPPPGDGTGDGARALFADLDLDGTLDALVPATSGWRAVQSVGLATQTTVDVELASDPARATVARSWLGDFDADLALELVLLTDSGLEIHDAAAATGKSLLLSLRGVKDNRRGVGAIVELRTGPIYQRVYWRGGTELLGAGVAETLDWLRITWPNGVVQYDPRLDLGDRRVTNDPLEAFKQVEGLIGSCPFLYTWNGTTFAFVSDVLGITPLGLPMGPGQLVPPDHDEYVLVRGDQLVPRDGFYEVQFTEELREVTYLDRIRLDVVDHPAGTEVFPEERFTFPPFPPAHVHTVRDALPPSSAVDQAGRDWSAELAAIDDEHAVPFEPAPSQYLGLATPHTLELGFDASRTAGASKLRLVFTGWFYWTDASVNMAVARDPNWSFVPPVLSVPDGEGGWRDTGPPIGFPAGKSKTMVVDVTDVLDRDDPRLRLFSTLRLYWDSIRLAVDDDDAELSITSLEPASARLWRRGFSAPERDASDDRPERFEWNRLADRPRWNPHPGLYTRLGETLPLVTEVDDRFVIMGSGEALTVRFDARTLPPPAEGLVRDYLVFLDGWAKDRDPNTHEALYVEPLPFHGMSGYPYGPDESFPDDPAHRAWRREWNTRPAEPWLTH